MTSGEAGELLGVACPPPALWPEGPCCNGKRTHGRMEGGRGWQAEVLLTRLCLHQDKLSRFLVARKGDPAAAAAMVAAHRAVRVLLEVSAPRRRALSPLVLLPPRSPCELTRWFPPQPVKNEDILPLMRADFCHFKGIAR